MLVSVQLAFLLRAASSQGSGTLLASSLQLHPANAAGWLRFQVSFRSSRLKGFSADPNIEEPISILSAVRKTGNDWEQLILKNREEDVAANVSLRITAADEEGSLYAAVLSGLDDIFALKGRTKKDTVFASLLAGFGKSFVKHSDDTTGGSLVLLVQLVPNRKKKNLDLSALNVTERRFVQSFSTAFSMGLHFLNIFWHRTLS